MILKKINNFSKNIIEWKLDIGLTWKFIHYYLFIIFIPLFSKILHTMEYEICTVVVYMEEKHIKLNIKKNINYGRI